MTTPDPGPVPPIPAPQPSNGWGPPSMDAPSYGPRPEPRYGQYAPPGSVPPVPAYGNPQYGATQYGAPQYGSTPGGDYSFAGAPVATAPKPGIIPLHPLTLGEIFDGTFAAIRHNPRVMLGLPAIVIALSTALGMAVGYFASGYIPQLVDLPDEETTTLIVANLGLVGSALASAIAYPIVTGLLIGNISQSVLGRKLTVGDLWQRVGRRIWALLGFTLAVLLIELVILAGWIAAIVALAYVNVGAAIAVGIGGGLAILVAAVWFSIRTLLIPPALILEGRGLRSAVQRGWRLSRGSFWRILGIYLLASIAMSIVSWILSVPQSVLSMLVQDNLAALLSIQGVAAVITGTITSGFLAGVVCLLYIDVRMRREGLDVELVAASQEEGASTR